MSRADYASKTRAMVALLHAHGVPVDEPFPARLWRAMVIDCLELGPRSVQEISDTATTLGLIETDKGDKQNGKETVIWLTEQGKAELQPSIDEAVLAYQFEPTD